MDIVILHHSIKTGGVTHTVPLHYEVVDGHLEVLGADGQSLDLGCGYYNTTMTSKVLLYNNSPASTEFIVILNNDSAVREEVRIMATFLFIALSARVLIPVVHWHWPVLKEVWCRRNGRSKELLHPLVK